MRKILFCLMSLIIFASIAICDVPITAYVQKDNIFAAGTGKNMIVVSSLGVVYANDIRLSSGIPVQATYLALIAATTTSIFRVDISTLVAVSSKVYSGGFLSQPAYPRGLEIKLYFEIAKYGVDLATAVIYGTTIVRGLDAKGNYIEETVITTNTARATGGKTKNAFSRVDSLELTTVSKGMSTLTGGKDIMVNTDAGGITWSVGVSTVVGLPGDVDWTGDVYHVIENAEDSVTFVANAVYDTIVFALSPNGTYNYVVYLLGRKSH